MNFQKGHAADKSDSLNEGKLMSIHVGFMWQFDDK